MSDRYYSTGSSRSGHDSRAHRERREDKESRERRRTRSRSPKRQSPARSSRHSSESSRSPDRQKREDKKIKNDWESSDEEVPAPPPPPRITKISMGFSKPKAPIKMNISSAAKPIAVPKPGVASVFSADDDDDEPEEMPAEARMRMRNIGRETPTSAGPNSFGKTKQGFCDAKKVFEKNLKEALETEVKKPALPKFPQTIYKIKGP